MTITMLELEEGENMRIEVQTAGPDGVGGWFSLPASVSSMDEMDEDALGTIIHDHVMDITDSEYAFYHPEIVADDEYPGVYSFSCEPISESEQRTAALERQAELNSDR